MGSLRGGGSTRCGKMMAREEVVGQKAREEWPVPPVLVYVFGQTQDDYSKQMSTNWVERRIEFKFDT